MSDERSPTRPRNDQPPLDKDAVLKVLEVYKTAWERQDPELILTIFTEDATYQENVLEVPFMGHDGIRSYWQAKVVAEQARIDFRLLNIYVDGQIAIAEWEVFLDDRRERRRKQMREVAILEFDGHRIASLREYWTAKVISRI